MPYHYTPILLPSPDPHPPCAVTRNRHINPFSHNERLITILLYCYIALTIILHCAGTRNLHYPQIPNHPNPKLHLLPFQLLLMETPINVETMVSDLVNRTEKCSCDEYRIELPSFQNESKTCKLSLIGKIFTARNFNYSMVKDIVTKAWSVTFPVMVKK